MISFFTPTVLDLRAAITLGVSVKENDSPIGMFGTGFKYALATLLRTNHKIEIIINTGQTLRHFKAISQKEIIRNQPFDLIFLQADEELIPTGFTTALGKNWTPNEAFRELHSNTLDEKGQTKDFSENELRAILNSPEPFTLICVSGDGIDSAYRNKDKLFLNFDPRNRVRVPVICTPFAELYDEPSHFLYYRGVLAAPLEKPSCFTYNILISCPLTEDRTFSSLWIPKFYIEDLLALKATIEMGEKIFQHWSNSFEGTLTASKLVTKPNSGMVLAATRLFRQGQQLPGDVVSFLRSVDSEGFSLKGEVPSTLQTQYINAAIAILKKMSLIRDYPYPILISNLPNNTLALAKLQSKQVLLSPDVFQHGTKFLASTLFEEYLHLHKGLEDESRAMQNFLFETIFSQYEIYTQEILS